MIDHLRQEVLSMVKNSFNEENAYLKKCLRHVICKGQEEQEKILKSGFDGSVYSFNVKGFNFLLKLLSS